VRTISIGFAVPWDDAGIRVACAALTTINRIYLRQHPTTPALYRAGVVYKRQPGPERFSWIPIVMQRGNGDCDQLACWRAAELQERGIKARAVPKRIGPNLIHILVQYPDGHKEDPSKVLGMGR